MKKILLFAIAILLAVFLGLLLKQDSGYILITYKQTIIETSLWVGIIFIVVSFFILYYLIRLIRYLKNIPEATKHWKQSRRLTQNYDQLNKSLLNILNGKYKQAQQILLKSIDKKKEPVLYYLLAAITAQKLSDIQHRDKCLSLAYNFTDNKHTRYTVGIVQAKLQLANQEYESALATLNSLTDISPNNRLVLEYLAETYINLNDWNNILKLLPDLARYQVFQKDRLLEIEIKAASNYFSTIKLDLSDDKSAANIIQGVFNNLSKKARWSIAVSINYIKCLSRLSGLSKLSNGEAKLDHKNYNKDYYIDYSIELINNLLKNKYTDQEKTQLLELYFNIAVDNQHLEKLEKILKKDNYNISLLFYLGKIAVKISEYEKAYQYLNQAKKLSASSNLNHDGNIDRNIDIDNYLAFVLLKQNNPKQSLELFEQHFTKIYQQVS